MRRTPYFALIFILAALGSVSAQEPTLNSAGAPYAPMDVPKHGAHDPSLPLSYTERDELLSEFKGLVHMGMRQVTYERWEGKDMADCDKGQRQDRWNYRCQIITGEGNGYYYFYPSETRQASTLQELDIRVDAADEHVLDDFRRPVQQLFGRASIVQKPAVNAKPSGPIRHWETPSDVAELFIDHGERPEGSVRFVWMRSPLVSTAHASLPPQLEDPDNQ